MEVMKSFPFDGLHFPEVDAESRTPYSDATAWTRKVAESELARSMHGRRSSDRAGHLVSRSHVKRPMNAFMVWSQIQRRAIVATKPGLHNAVISKQLGQLWNSLTPEEREPFVAESERLRRFHMIEFPDYKYQPRRKSVTMNMITNSRPSNSRLQSQSQLLSTRLNQARKERQQKRYRRMRNSCGSSITEDADSDLELSDSIDQNVLKSADAADDDEDLLLDTLSVGNKNQTSAEDDYPNIRLIVNGLQMAEPETHTAYVCDVDCNNIDGLVLSPSEVGGVYANCDVDFGYYSTPEVDDLLIANDWLLDTCNDWPVENVSYDVKCL